MAKPSRDFQVFVKPAGSLCNLSCAYCYYLEKRSLYPKSASPRMSDAVLEAYIVQHLAAAPGPVIAFSWHGGEPTVLGLDYFRRIAALQRKHRPSGSRVANGLQTNGTLLDEEWARFLAEEGFAVGLSLDGPRELHDHYRVTNDRRPTHEKARRAYELLRRHEVPTDILCVVSAHNVRFPAEVYGFFKDIGASHLTFLPLVEPQGLSASGATSRSVPAEAWGEFLCAVFDEWRAADIGRLKVQIFDEAARTAFGEEHSLCLFRPTCGDVPVVEHNGDFYSCDHFVDPDHLVGNIRVTPLLELLESRAQRAFGQAKLNTLPRRCRACEVLAMCNGECPRNRFILSPDGDAGLNYLCAGYKRFFTRCRPFVAAVEAEWRRRNLERRGNPTPRQSSPARAVAQPGRNDPCPCGSGLKYKKCCLGKQNMDPSPGSGRPDGPGVLE